MLILLAATASALQFGDPAPPLTPQTWLQGGPTDTTGQVVVVEFFASWCGPCRQTIPHLNALQADNPDLVIIGVAADQEEPDSLLHRFIGATDMRYPAMTDAGGQTYDRYMNGLAVEAIPAAFLIDRTGRLVWQGHPTALDEPVAEALASPLPEVETAAHAPVPEVPEAPATAEAPSPAEEAGLWARFCAWCAQLFE